jgi:hypothetical protein
VSLIKRSSILLRWLTGHDCVEVGNPEGDHHLHIPETYPELDDSSGCEPDDDIDYFRELLMKCVSGEEDNFTFLNTFSSAERQKIHDICDQNLSQELR